MIVAIPLLVAGVYLLAHNQLWAGSVIIAFGTLYFGCALWNAWTR